MNKRVLGKKFSRDTTSRRAMYRALVRALVLNQAIVTTRTKAKVLIPIVESLLYKAKSTNFNIKRDVYRLMANDRQITERLFKIADKTTEKSGRYLKFVSLPARRGDNASMARVEFINKIEILDEENKTKGSKRISEAEKEKDVKEKRGSKKKSAVSALKKISLKKKSVSKK